MIREYLVWLPDPLRQAGPWGVAWWQWIGIVLLVALSFVAGHLLIALVRPLIRRIVQSSRVTWDNDLFSRIDRPSRWLASVVIARMAMPLLLFGPKSQAKIDQIMNAAIGLGILRIAVAAIDVFVQHVTKASWAMARPASRALVVLAGRVAKVGVAIIVVISIVASFGVPVGSLLAGLGIGGIALAFGAQKTVENLFGAFALGIDQPLREGDFVTLENNVQGTVELIGLRSTRVRTLDRTLVSLPNGRVADMRIETFAARDRCRYAGTIGLVYATTAQQLREVLEGFEKALRAHPKIFAEDVVVKLARFGDSALEIEVVAVFVTADFNQFRVWRQEMLLSFLDVIERAGTALAYPSRTLYLDTATSQALLPPRDGTTRPAAAGSS